jgi:hypothetical protein
MPTRRDAAISRGRGRRGAVVALAGVVVVAAALVAMSVPASAHDASIFVDCHEVFVGFQAFPAEAIPVHIAVQVGDIGSKTSDVLVDQHTNEKKVDISDLTASVHGPIQVHVDVTWTFEGPQERQKTANLECNQSGSTSTVENTSVTSIPGGGGGGGTSTSVEAASSTSTPVTTGGGGGSTSTTFAGGAVSSTSSVTAAGNSTSTSFLAVSAEAASSSLPFTGGASLPLLVFGLALIAGGCAFMFAPRRRSSRP